MGEPFDAGLRPHSRGYGVGKNGVGAGVICDNRESFYHDGKLQPGLGQRALGVRVFSARLGHRTILMPSTN